MLLQDTVTKQRRLYHYWIRFNLKGTFFSNKSREDFGCNNVNFLGIDLLHWILVQS